MWCRVKGKKVDKQMLTRGLDAGWNWIVRGNGVEQDREQERAKENEKRRRASCNSYQVNMEECGSHTQRAEQNAVDYG